MTKTEAEEKVAENPTRFFLHSHYVRNKPTTYSVWDSLEKRIICK